MGEDKTNTNPYDRANVISRLFLCWLTPTIVKLYKKTIDSSGLDNCSAPDRCDFIGPRLQSTWDAEKAKSQQNKKARLWLAMVRCLGMTRIVIYLTLCCVGGLWKGLVLYLLLVFAQTLQMDNIPYNQLYLVTGCLSICVIVMSTLVQFNIFYGMATGNRMSAAVSYVIYNKCLRLNQEALGETSVGQIITMLSSDIKRLEVLLSIFPTNVSGVFSLIIGMILLWPYFNVTTFAGVGILFLSVPYWISMSKTLKTLRHTISRITDERTRLFSDLVTGIRVIKMYAWESVFKKMIADVRKKELKSIWDFCFRRSMNYSMFVLSDKIMLFAVFLVAVFVARLHISLEAVFFAFAVFGEVKSAIFYAIPLAVEYGANTYSALQRIQNFLMLPEKARHPMISDYQDDEIPKLIIKDLKARWSSATEEVDFSDLTVTLTVGDILIVTGPVGAGKTSFLLSLLGECPLNSGSIECHGKIAYVPQEPWIVSGSLRENVTMWGPFDEERYVNVLRTCALMKDVQQLPNGDMTLVGERGVQLSGGQKARVNLARAVYADCDIYLIDDPLSAVDPHVADHLFKSVIQDFLKDKVCILVTHHIQYLKEATQVIITKKGKVVASGTYDDVAASAAELFTKQHRKSEAELFMNEKEQNERRKDSVAHQLLGDDYVAMEEEDDFNASDVSANIYSKYISVLGGGFLIGTVALVSVLGQSVASFSEIWFFMWLPFSSSYVDQHNSSVTFNITRPFMDWAYTGVFSYNVLLCVGLFALTFMLSTTSSMMIYTRGTSGSKKIHTNALVNLLDCPTSFFDTNADGKILNRVTRDMSVVDEDISFRVTDGSKTLLWNFASVSVAMLFRLWMVIPIIIVVSVTVIFLSSYRVVSRNMKAVESGQITTVFSHLTTTLRGLAVIRTFKGEDMFLEKYCRQRDTVTSSFFFYFSMIRYSSLCMEYMCDFYTVLIAWATIFFVDFEHESRVAPLFALASAFTLGITFQMSVNMLIEVDAMMVSLERILQYERLPSETELDKSIGDKITLEADWPRMGEIVFRDVSLVYESTSAPALKNINFYVKPGEKVGIVGRTGAGKSSLVAALFRFVAVEGNIIIDGVPIHKIEIKQLRKKLSVIPQDPMLFTGTIRSNLDPFSEYPDYKLWNVLEEVQLKKAVQDLRDGLSTLITEGELAFSVGERQLFCLARAILRNNTILIMDEATANVDLMTDALIQETIRSKFRNCTVLTIAHRLHTIMDCDQVMVLEGGCLVEFDSPHLLLQKESGKFKDMVQQTGKSSAKLLSNIALKAYSKRNPSLENKDF